MSYYDAKITIFKDYCIFEGNKMSLSININKISVCTEYKYE